MKLTSKEIKMSSTAKPTVYNRYVFPLDVMPEYDVMKENCEHHHVRLTHIRGESKKFVDFLNNFYN